MKTIKFLVCICAFYACLSAQALTVDSKTIKNPKAFGIEFPDGTSIYGIADWFESVSRQEYIVGPMIVTEVSIDLLGAGSKIRIYNARLLDATTTATMMQEQTPKTLNQINLNSFAATVDKAKNMSGSEIRKNRVHKEYPTTTNSHTLEFVVPDIEELELFYKKILSDFIGKPLEEEDNAKVKYTDVPNTPSIAGKIYKISDPNADSVITEKKSESSKNQSGDKSKK